MLRFALPDAKLLYCVTGAVGGMLVEALEAVVALSGRRTVFFLHESSASRCRFRRVA